LDKAKYIVKTFQGLEAVLEKELHDLGIESTEQLNRSVAFEADFEQMMQANLCLRTGLRIYQPLFDFEFKDEVQMYKVLNNFSWDKYIGMEQTFAIENVVVTKAVKNSHFISLKAKDAIADYFFAKYKKRPSVDVRWPDIRIQVYISKTHNCVVSIDTTGEPLYKRGYKKRQTEASINECLAAGLILMTGWKGEKDFYDMMAGSGTLTAEALMIASNYPVNIHREKWPFFQLEGFSMPAFKKLQQDIRDRIITPEIDFYVNEKANEAFDIAKMNLFDLKVNTSRLQFSRDNFFEITPNTKGILVLNPPYDERLEMKDIELFYKDIGDMLKRHYTGFDVWIISANKAAMKKIGLKSSIRYHIVNSNLDCEFCKYEMY
jgi:putative N6-adenine-specific DNA methylase